MPLEKAPAGSPGFSRNIKREIAAGKPQEQAVAIAYNKARSDTAWPTSTEDDRLQMPQMAPRLDADTKDGDLIIKHISDEIEEEKFRAACDRATSLAHRLDQLERRDAIKSLSRS